MSPIPEATGPGHEMSLLGHLEELRSRLVRVIIAAVVGFGCCFAFAERILEIMLKPLKQVLPQSSTIQATALTESFFVSMKAAFVAGIFLASPYIFYQIWSFIAPGLYEEERKLAIPVAFFTALCFVSGACFGYFIVFPYGFTFLANYGSDIVTLNPKLSEYYSMALGLLFAFGIIFEMPIFIFFLARLGVVDSKWLREKRRWAIVIIFVVAAVVTPTPDVVNQLLMAVPMVILYEVSIWVAHFFGKRKPKPEDENLPAVQEEGGEPSPAQEAPAQAAATAPETQNQDYDAHTAAELAYGETAPQNTQEHAADAQSAETKASEVLSAGPHEPETAEAPAHPTGEGAAADANAADTTVKAAPEAKAPEGEPKK